jgi:hypothetical protein
MLKPSSILYSSLIYTFLIAIRIRPLTDRDRAQPRFANSTGTDVLRAHEKHVQIVSQNKYFTYDHVFSTNDQQNDIFTALGQQPVNKFVEGRT